MIRSMTAFARVNIPAKDQNWAIEIRSLNHRFFEFSTKLPSSLSSLEGQLKELVQNEIKRGKVMVSVSQESSEKVVKSLSVDEDVLKGYLTSLRKLKKAHSLEGEVSVSDVLKLPGVFTSESKQESVVKQWPSLKRVVRTALNEAVKAKIVEGAKLAKDIHDRLSKIKKVVEKVEKLGEGRSQKVYKKLNEKVSKLLTDKVKDEDRLYREVALIAERSDITEEVVRLRSHIDLFLSRLTKKGEVGRELDFLCQEMNREINTIGSKAQLFEIATEVVGLKGELEKIREQVQNIE